MPPLKGLTRPVLLRSLHLKAECRMAAEKKIVSSDVEKDTGSVIEIPYAQRDWHHSHRWTRRFLQWGLETRGAFTFNVSRPDYLIPAMKALHPLPRRIVSTPSTVKYFSFGCLPTSIFYRASSPDSTHRLFRLSWLIHICRFSAGTLGPVVFGLGLRDSCLVILFFNLLCSALPAYL